MKRDEAMKAYWEETPTRERAEEVKVLDKEVRLCVARERKPFKPPVPCLASGAITTIFGWFSVLCV